MTRTLEEQKRSVLEALEGADEFILIRWKDGHGLKIINYVPTRGFTMLGAISLIQDEFLKGLRKGAEESMETPPKKRKKK